MKKSVSYNLVNIFFIIALVILWLTHIITCIFYENYLFLIAGAILPHIGIIHGWIILLGIAYG
jgi:hypothetical protein